MEIENAIFQDLDSFGKENGYGKACDLYLEKF